MPTRVSGAVRKFVFCFPQSLLFDATRAGPGGAGRGGRVGPLLSYRAFGRPGRSGLGMSRAIRSATFSGTANKRSSGEGPGRNDQTAIIGTRANQAHICGTLEVELASCSLPQRDPRKTALRRKFQIMNSIRKARVLFLKFKFGSYYTMTRRLQGNVFWHRQK